VQAMEKHIKKKKSKTKSFRFTSYPIKKKNNKTGKQGEALEHK